MCCALFYRPEPHCTQRSSDKHPRYTTSLPLAGCSYPHSFTTHHIEYKELLTQLFTGVIRISHLSRYQFNQLSIVSGPVQFNSIRSNFSRTKLNGWNGGDNNGTKQRGVFRLAQCLHRLFWIIFWVRSRLIWPHSECWSEKNLSRWLQEQINIGLNLIFN